MSFTSRERRQLHAEGWRRAGPREREDGHELIRISVRRGKLECDGCSRTFKYARGLGNHRKQFGLGLSRRQKSVLGEPKKLTAVAPYSVRLIPGAHQVP